MSNHASKSAKSPARSTWASRTLLTLTCCVVSVLGITTLNGWAASGFTHVPNAFLEIFGSAIAPLPKAPPGYVAITPSTLQQDFEHGKDSYLGQKVSIYGKLLPWKSGSDDIKEDPSVPPVNPIPTRPGTFILALYVDPSEHPDLSAHPVIVTVREDEEWKEEHAGIQSQWVQVTGTVVAYNPGEGQPSPEIQADDVRVIPEPFDIYDHNIPIQNPEEEHD